MICTSQIEDVSQRLCSKNLWLKGTFARVEEFRQHSTLVPPGKTTSSKVSLKCRPDSGTGHFLRHVESLLPVRIVEKVLVRLSANKNLEGLLLLQFQEVKQICHRSVVVNRVVLIMHIQNWDTMFYCHFMCSVVPLNVPKPFTVTRKLQILSILRFQDFNHWALQKNISVIQVQTTLERKGVSIYQKWSAKI